MGSLTKINKAFSVLEQKYEREPTPDELAECLEMGAEEVKTTLGLAGRHVSMDAPFNDEDGNCLVDILENPDAETADVEVEYHFSLRVETERTLQTLTERERGVLKLFYGIGVDNPMTLSDIGEVMGLTRERVRQIKDKSINKLRASARSQSLKAYLCQ